MCKVGRESVLPLSELEDSTRSVSSWRVKSCGEGVWLLEHDEPSDSEPSNKSRDAARCRKPGGSRDVRSPIGNDIGADAGAEDGATVPASELSVPAGRGASCSCKYAAEEVDSRAKLLKENGSCGLGKSVRCECAHMLRARAACAADTARALVRRWRCESGRLATPTSCQSSAMPRWIC